MLLSKISVINVIASQCPIGTVYTYMGDVFIIIRHPFSAALELPRQQHRYYIGVNGAFITRSMYCVVCFASQRRQSKQ